LTLEDLARTVDGLRGRQPLLEAILLHPADKGLYNWLKRHAKEPNPEAISGAVSLLANGVPALGSVKLFVWDGTVEQLVRLGFSEAPSPGEGVLRYVGDPIGEPS
jgi:hypothetical protein